MSQLNADTADFLSDVENEKEIARQEIQFANILNRLDNDEYWKVENEIENRERREQENYEWCHDV
jgi:hypothetical protein